MKRVLAESIKQLDRPELYSNKKIIRDLEKDIENFDQILLVIDGKGIAEHLTVRVSEHIRRHHLDKKVLVLSRGSGDRDNGVPDNEEADRDSEGTRRISEEDERILLAVYRMYDFSDRFSVLSDDIHYGSVLNYVKTGEMSWEEVFCAILRG